MTSLHAALSGDRQKLILVAAGEYAEDVAVAARRLQTLTPLFTKSDPPGALLAPLTWPLVVQLEATFGSMLHKHADLQAWIDEEIARRVGGAESIAYVPPAGLTPYPWQVAGAAMIATTGGALITDEPGCIYGDALMAINRNGKGFTIKLRDLVARFNGIGNYPGAQWDLSRPTYVQREVDGVVRLGRIVNAWSSGVKKTYTVTTETGRMIRATDEHPFLTERGWLRLDQLVVGDRVHVRGQQRGEGCQAKPQYREVAGLRAHPHARGLRRRTSTHRVAFHRLVAEAELNGLGVGAYIRRLRAGTTDGLQFLDPATHAVHHKDHNHLNNAPGNLEVLTHEEHRLRHAAEGHTEHVLFKVTTERVFSITPYGEEETFDIEVSDDPHNFIADGFVVHNTGKTITAILGLMEVAVRHGLGELLGAGGPALVICPASVVDSWVEAWRTWAPHVSTVAWRGPKRRALLGTADVYVTSYDTARIDAPTGGTKGRRPLVDLGAAHVVIDECHLIKNNQTQRSKAVRRLAKKAGKSRGTVVALSGTPITHHPGDLWATLEAMEPDAWPAKDRWIHRYCETVPGEDYQETVLGLHPRTEPEFRLTLLGQHRRVAKADVLAQLPPKVYSVRTVDLPERWRKVYDDFEEQMLAELPSDDGAGQELRVMDVMSKFTHLSSLASAAADVRVEIGPDVDEQTGEPKRHVHLDLKAPSWKVEGLLEVLAERPGEPVVAFASSRQLVVLAGAAAEAAGLRVGYIVGGQSAGERTRNLEAFQAGQLDLICVTTSAGGVGITLTAARTCVFLQRPWSLVDAIQAEDRCHRIGSEIHDSVEVIDIVARNTIDTRVRAVLRERAGQLADLVQDPRIVAELLGGSRVTRSDLPLERAS